MESIYVMEPGCYVRREGSALHVVKDGRVIDRIPAEPRVGTVRFLARELYLHMQQPLLGNNDAEIIRIQDQRGIGSEDLFFQQRLKP